MEKGTFNPRGCQEGTKTRPASAKGHKARVTGMFEDLQGSRYGWSRVKRALGEDFLMDSA